jgi:uncharacterized membrane protein
LFELLFKYSREDYARSDLVYLGEWPPGLLAALGILAIAGIAFLLYRQRQGARAGQLATVGLLQIAMLGVVAWVLMQPTLATDRLREGENAIAIVVDASQSMAYGEPQTRFSEALGSLNDALEEEDLPALDTRYYELGGASRAVESFVASEPADGATSFAASLTGILEEARFSPLAAVVLASDGADTSGGLAADELAALAAYGVPVHTIGVGRTSIPEDVEIDDVTVPARALPGSTVSARVTIRHDGPASALVKVYDGNELLQIEPVELPPGTGSTTAWIDVGLDRAGPHELTFSVDAGATEPELRNNTRSTLVEVSNQQYRVLYFEGEPRWEYKFLRRAVGSDEDLGLATLLRVSPNKFYRQGIDSPEQLQDGFPKTRDELFGYDALIIGSVEAAMLSPEQQQMIRDFVSERGGSLLMLAGPNGLGNGGWGQSAIADVLPASLPPSSTDSFHRKKATASLTPQGVASQMLRFDAETDANLDAWRSLPEIGDYQVTGNLKPAAVVLLNAETDIGDLPLLLTQPFGRGNAYILATGGTWRWQMSMPVEDLKHETFWRQVLRALVVSAPDNVSLATGSSGQGGRISLRAEFRDDAFNPVDDIAVTAVASHEGGESLSVRMLPSSEPGVFTGEMEPPMSGTWYFEALADRDGEPVAVGRSSLLYESDQAEHFGFRANPALLQRLSDATGGQFFEAGDLTGLGDLLRYSSSGITETEFRSIWDAPAVFLLLLLLKAGEWLLRRRWKSI